MKKSLLALAVLGVFAGGASAQSSVTLSGTLDVGAKYVKNTGAKSRYSLDNNGINTSQLVFSGIEDLGGGLKAGFELNSGLAIDTGGAGGGASFFNRRSVARLMGNFGEIRLGRDYAPSFWNTTVFDAFGTNGVGNSLNVIAPSAAIGVARLYMGTRRDNSIGYFLPTNIGGVYGQAMVAASENVAGVSSETDRGGRYYGARIGWAGGPANVAFSYGNQRYASGAPTTKTYNLGGSYDLGVVKLLGYWDHETETNKKGNLLSFSAVVPFGQSEIHAGYDYDKLDVAGTKTKVDQFKLGYVYNLSKRTAMYSTVSRLSNKNATALFIPGGNLPGAATGFKSTAAEFGIRHFF